MTEGYTPEVVAAWQAFTLGWLEAILPPAMVTDDMEITLRQLQEIAAAFKTWVATAEDHEKNPRGAYASGAASAVLTDAMRNSPLVDVAEDW